MQDLSRKNLASTTQPSGGQSPIQKPHVLFVLPDVPFPARRNGLTLRYHSLLQHLRAHFEITLVVVVSRDVDLSPLSSYCDEAIPLYRPETPPRLIKRIAAQFNRILPVGVPYSYYDHEAHYLASQMQPILCRKFDSVVCVALYHMLDLCGPAFRRHHLVLDAIDSITLYLMRDNPRPSPMTWLRINKMRRWEATLLNRANTGFYISPVDLATIRHLTSGVDLHISPNGTLIEDYTEDKAPLRSPSIGFLGNMSYRPNIDAAHRLHRLYRALKATITGLNLYIIGRDPDDSITALSSDPDVHVTGTVDNIWPFVNAVDVFVMPMAKGSGQQNKLLEVMYAGRPLVTTHIGNGGVMGIDGESLLIADDEETLKQQVSRLLGDEALRAQLSDNARTFVRSTYDWDSIARRFAREITHRKSSQ